LSSGATVLASRVKRKDSRRGTGPFFDSVCVAFDMNSPSHKFYDLESSVLLVGTHCGLTFFMADFFTPFNADSR
jgi:hypothetical protein